MVTEMLSAVTRNTSTFFQPHNNFPAQSLHFRFGSVAPCPTLKSDVTVSTPRTRYGRLARPYPTGFSCYIQSAYKSKQNFFHLLEEISHADFSARTLGYCTIDCLFRKLLSSKNGQKKTSKSLADLEA